MGHLPNKARKLEAEARVREEADRKANGWAVFHSDYKPSLTRSDMTLGQAVRYLMRVTGTRISFWRCPLRGLAIQYLKLPTSSKIYDHGETYRVMSFSPLTDEVEAKKAPVMDMLLSGIELYRALPNAMFREDIQCIRWLLKAPPSVTAEEWKEVLAKRDERVQRVIRSHEPELRFHLLEETYSGPTGTVGMTARIRLEA